MASGTPEVTAAPFTKGSLTEQAGNTSFPISLGNNRLFPGISRLLDYLGKDKQPGKNSSAESCTAEARWWSKTKACAVGTKMATIKGWSLTWEKTGERSNRIRAGCPSVQDPGKGLGRGRHQQSLGRARKEASLKESFLQSEAGLLVFLVVNFHEHKF